jgi:hypothetical protein
VGASRYLSDDIHRGRGEEECYNNSNIDDYDGDHDNNDSNNDNDKNNEDSNNDDSNLKGTNNTDTNKTCLNYEKISTITEKNDLKSHTFFENIKWDFLIQNPVPPFWAQTGTLYGHFCVVVCLYVYIDIYVCVCMYVCVCIYTQNYRCIHKIRSLPSGLRQVHYMLYFS